MASYPNATTGTLAAATPADVTLQVTGRSLTIILKNTGGTNALTTTNVYKSPTGTLYAEDTALTAAIGSIATGASKLIELSDCAFDFVKLTLTSTSGTTYSVESRGR